MYTVPKDFYKALEDKFRGSREVIADRQKVYLPLLERAFGPAVPGDAPVAVDIGCGRGEWVQLLKDQGWRCKGVDTDADMLADCIACGLDVEQADALEYLDTLPEGSVSLVTAFHVVEHLPLGHVIELFRRTARVLAPGGLAIFESPNAENVVVGAHLFYLDPTHVHPIPPLLLQFIGEFTGFGTSEIFRLHAPPNPQFPEAVAAALEPVMPYFWGPLDYSVILSVEAARAALVTSFIEDSERSRGESPAGEKQDGEGNAVDAAEPGPVGLFPLNRFFKQFIGEGRNKGPRG